MARRAFFSWCPCCGSSPCRDTWESYYNLVRFDLADTPGGAADVEFVARHRITVDSRHYYDIELSGEGSMTVQIPPPTDQLIVGTYPRFGTSGAGVTIRRADSEDNISLVLVSGGDLELRVGGTVLETVPYSAAFAFRLVLTTPLLTTTDIEVWGFSGSFSDPIGTGTLLHTEVGVPWTPPEDIWNVGLITEGANSRFHWLEILPCPKILECELPECFAVPTLDEPVPVSPVSWTLEVPAITGPGVCQYYGDVTFTLINVSHGIGTIYLHDPSNAPTYWGWGAPFMSFPDPPYFSGDDTVVSLGCGYMGVMESRAPANVDLCGGPTLSQYPGTYSEQSPGSFPVKWVGNCGTSEQVEYTYERDGFGARIQLQYINRGTFIEPDYEYRVVLYLGFSGFSFIGGRTYYSGWFPLLGNEMIEGGFTLAAVPDSGFWDCVLPSTITVTANTPGSVPIDSRVMNCKEVSCDPLDSLGLPPAQGYEYHIWITFEDENDGVWDYPTCLGLNYIEESDSWEWFGYSAQGHVHPTCGALPDQIDFEVKIHCVEPQEGMRKQWVLEITTPNGTARIPQVEDVNLGYVFEGTVGNMCSGQTWNIAATPLSRVDPETSTTLGGCPKSPCTALWLRGGITIGCADSSYVQSSVYLSSMAKGNPGSPPSEWTVPGVDPALIIDNDVYGGIFPFGGGAYRIWVYSVSGGSYQVRITGPGDELITATGEGLVCQPGGPSLNLASAPYDWFGRPGGDPFGVCPGLDDSAFIDFVWF